MKTILFNPFEKYSDRILLLAGLFFNSAGILLGFAFNARFDGFLDLHFIETTTFLQVLLESCIDIACGTILFFFIGKLINQKTRLIDILTTCLIAKIPMYLIAFLNTNGMMYALQSKVVSQTKPEDISSMDLGMLMTSIPILIWYIILLFNGFKTATNAKETKHILLFILAIIITEIITKILIKLI